MGELRDGEAKDDDLTSNLKTHLVRGEREVMWITYLGVLGKTVEKIPE